MGTFCLVFFSPFFFFLPLTVLQVYIIILAVSYFELLGLWQLCVPACVQCVLTICSVLSETEVRYEK